MQEKPLGDFTEVQVRGDLDKGHSRGNGEKLAGFKR